MFSRKRKAMPKAHYELKSWNSFWRFEEFRICWFWRLCTRLSIRWNGGRQESAQLQGNRNVTLVEAQTRRGVCSKAPCYCIIMEYYGTLYDVLQRRDPSILPPQVVGWSRQIASGMQFLHLHCIIHRDLKSPNVLVSGTNQLKVNDFGNNRSLGKKNTRMTFAGTVAWMAPEMIREEPCSEKVDVWSFGAAGCCSPLPRWSRKTQCHCMAFLASAVPIVTLYQFHNHVICHSES